MKNAKNTKSKSKSDDFVPDDAISEGSSAYMKLDAGENKVRIISKPVIGWVEWIDKKPNRTQIDDEPEATDAENPPKKFFTVVAIDRADGLVKIMELTQQSVIKAIKALSGNPDWGAPFAYDITIKKSGEGLKTKYAVTPSPKKKLEKEMVKLAQSKPCNLEKVFENEDPWSVEGDDDTTEYIFQ